MTHPFHEHLGPLAIVHRGGAQEAAENSFAAFQRAVDLGFRYLETDVHATADGVLLAFHDARLDRVTDGSGRIARLRYEEVAQVRIGGTDPIPLLADLLEAFPSARFNIDAKAVGAMRPLAELLARTRSLPRVNLGAFSDRRLAWLRTALGPGLSTSLGPREVMLLKHVSLRGGRTRFPTTARCVQVPPSVGPLPLVDRAFVDAAHHHGLPVHVWTIDDADAMDRLLDLGVDGIMTDRPELLRGVLVRRGQWPGPIPGLEPPHVV